MRILWNYHSPFWGPRGGPVTHNVRCEATCHCNSDNSLNEIIYLASVYKINQTEEGRSAAESKPAKFSANQRYWLCTQLEHLVIPAEVASFLQTIWIIDITGGQWGSNQGEAHWGMLASFIMRKSTMPPNRVFIFSGAYMMLQHCQVSGKVGETKAT